VFVDSFVDDLTYVRDFKVCMEGMICHIKGSIFYVSDDFLLCSLHDCCVGVAGTSPEFYSISPNRFNHRFVN
jgi:hypothetical protein